jgi:hypothetical protein
MNPKAKKLTTGVLAMTAVAIWVPQIFTGVVQKAPSPRPEYDEADEFGEDEFDDESDVAYEGYDEFDDLGYTDDMDETSDETWDTASTSGSLADQLEQTTERLRAFGGPQRVDLDQLLTSFQARVNTPQVIEDTPATPTRSVKTGSESLALQLASDALDQFALEQPLTAIIHGESGSLAMLGGRIVRVGDELSPGIRVTEINARRMRIAGGGNARWLELAPFRARPTLGDSETDDDTDSAPAPPGNDLRYLSASDVLSTPIATTPVLEESAADTSSEND